ncbi:hypothetical protein EKD04_012925 [Chloroflexales bacterium ZM16-3]|nr:hypothetical protein [Chloroflexales bacterium ZM16-3]
MAKVTPTKISNAAINVRFPLGSSKHHKYPTLRGKEITSYRKTVVYALGMSRLNEANHDQVLEVVLISDENSLDPVSKVWTFNPATDTIDFYSLDTLAWWEAMHSDLITRGLMIPYIGASLSTVRAVTDGDLLQIATLDTGAFEVEVNKLSEPVILRRIRGLMNPNDYTAVKFSIIDQRIASLDSSAQLIHAPIPDTLP